MKVTNKILTTLLIFLTAAAAFGNGGGEPSRETREKAVMSVMVVDDGQPAWSRGMELWTLARTASVADIIIDVTAVPREEYFTELVLTLESGNMPDVVQMYHPEIEELTDRYGSEGRLLAVDRYLFQMPNLKRQLEKFENQRKLITAGDGHMYHLPNIHQVRDQLFGGMIARTDWLKEEKVDYLNLKTTDELFDLLEVLQTRNRDENGSNAITGSRYGAWGVFHLAKVFGTRIGYEGPVYWDPELRQYTSHVENPVDMKAFLTFLRRMTDSGMWDRDYLTMPDSSWDSILRSGRWPFALEDDRWIDLLNEDLSETLGYDETRNLWGFVVPPPYRGKVQPWRYKLNRHLYYGWTVSADPQCPLDKLLRTLDWCYSGEGQLTWYYGKEGVTYKVDSTGRFRLLVWPWDTEGGGTKIFYEDIGAAHDWLFPSNTRLLNYRKASPVGYNPYPDDQKDIWEERVPLYEKPIVAFTDSEKDEVQSIEDEIRTKMSELVAGIILGERSAADYDSVAAFARERGIDRLIELYTVQHRRFYGE